MPKRRAKTHRKKAGKLKPRNKRTGRDRGTAKKMPVPLLSPNRRRPTPEKSTASQQSKATPKLRST